MRHLVLMDGRGRPSRWSICASPWYQGTISAIRNAYVLGDRVYRDTVCLWYERNGGGDYSSDGVPSLPVTKQPELSMMSVFSASITT